jgi:hypothetical protein
VIVGCDAAAVRPDLGEILVVTTPGHEDEAHATAARAGQLRSASEADHRRLAVTASTGVAAGWAGADDARAFLRDAQLVAAIALREGGGRTVAFDDALGEVSAAMTLWRDGESAGVPHSNHHRRNHRRYTRRGGPCLSSIKASMGWRAVVASIRWRPRCMGIVGGRCRRRQSRRVAHPDARSSAPMGSGLHTGRDDRGSPPSL